jgi:RNA polymerase sigma factor (sigma-70 family)
MSRKTQVNAQTPELQLAEAIHGNLEEARAALERRDDERALQFLQQAVRRKHELWDRLEPQVRRLARAFAGYGRRAAHMGEDDFTQEAFLKFRRAVGRWDPSQGVGVQCYLQTVLRNHFVGLGRRGQHELAGGDLDYRGSNWNSEDSQRQDARLEVQGILEGVLPDDPRREEKLLAFRRYYLEGGWTLTDLAEDFAVCVATMHRWVNQILSAVTAAMVQA